jgi:hypothetical protein
VNEANNRREFDARRTDRPPAADMTFIAGEHLGTYEIVGSLGAGGMGEVYRARDTRLKREVAIRQQYMVAPDGQSFVMNSMPNEATASPIMVILNWKPKR